ncbi:MAG: GNAT family N-acetyltransferase [Deltaproteobacteria bacterium]|nr:GNAT family N-acetyltransferase [Deltaproteobacteria bacterium]
MAPRRPAVVFTEKEFYLDEFRGRTLLFAVHHDGPADRLRALGEVTRDLLVNDTRVLILLGGAAVRERSALRALERPLAGVPSAAQVPLPLPQLRLVPSDGSGPVLRISADDLAASAIADPVLVRFWDVVRGTPFALGLCAADTPERLAAFAARLGARFRVHKLVIADPEGGIRPAGIEGPLSFMDEPMTGQLLAAGEAESSGLGARRALLEAVRTGLVDGISSINVCTLDGVARELFTYEGSGTLFTREDYCKVERLSLDDFHEVEKLLERGQREGYLKMRTPAEIALILFSGYGATIGQHHLAGVCSLQTERYEAERAGEIVGLYTITRFKGEGVGVKLVECMKAVGRERGLAYLFACTTQERVGQFFERQGFRAVAQSETPPAKWVGYDAERRHDLCCFRLVL